MPISPVKFLWLIDPHDLQGIPTPQLGKEAVLRRIILLAWVQPFQSKSIHLGRKY